MPEKRHRFFYRLLVAEKAKFIISNGAQRGVSLRSERSETSRQVKYLFKARGFSLALEMMKGVAK
jgi:hypothetical protein